MNIVGYLKANKKKIVRGTAIVVLLFGIINLAVAAYFNDRTYPNAMVGGKSVGNMALADLDKYVDSKLLPQKITVAFGKATASYSPKDLGVQIDRSKVVQSLTDNRWLPVLNLFSKHDSSLIIKTDSAKLTQTLESFATQHPQEQGVNTVIRLNIAKLEGDLVAGIQKGHSRILLPTIAVQAPKPTVVSPAPQQTPPKKTFTYCTATKGVDVAYLPELEAKLAAAFQDSRGWSLGGDVGFVKSASNCNFTVWLSAADQMASFGAICDSMWSCAVSPNVIINFDRWRYGSDAWNATGSSLEDYRTMVVNHETGHWLGFYHPNCGGAGQPAPVMQQQSISMQGCTPNSWPLQSELAQLRKHLKL